MGMNITGSTVASNAASGTLIGIFSPAPPVAGVVSFQLLSNPDGYFVMSAKGELYVAWIGSAIVGNYEIKVRGHGPGWDETDAFIIMIVPGVSPPPPSPGALTIEITFPGGLPTSSAVVFDIAAGTDIGNYVPPTASFVQRCVRVRNAALANFFVDFRPDVAGGRTEIVCWNGECLGTVPDGYTRDLPAYTAVIKSAGAVVHTESVPFHTWATRWRWQSAPRPVIRTAAQVFSEGWLPRMTKTAARIQGYSGGIVPITPPVVAPYTTFMNQDNAVAGTKLGLACGVDTGGERKEIGLVTEWQADYLLNGTASSLTSLIQQAEMCAGDWFFYNPDQITGAPVNFKQDAAHYAAYTYYNHYGNPGQYYQIGNGSVHNGWDIHESESHVPSVFYVPYALTEDAYYLEAVQYMQQWGAGWGIYQRENVYGTFGTFVICSYTNEIRTLGWGIRNLAMAYKTAPATPPSWMLPKSYYVSLSNDYAMVINRMFTTNITENRYQIFRQLSSDSFWQAFEQAYAIMGLALADLVGMPAIPSWRSALDFYFGFFEGLTNGISGWNRQCPQPHDLNSIDLNTLATWGAAWTHFQAILQTGATNPTAPSPGNQQGGSLGNASQIAAACACAKSRGVTAATNAMAWMNTFIDFNYPPAQQAFYAKCGFDGS